MVRDKKKNDKYVAGTLYQDCLTDKVWPETPFPPSSILLKPWERSTYNFRNSALQIDLLVVFSLVFLTIRSWITPL